LLQFDGLSDFVPRIGCSGVFGVRFESRAQLGLVRGLGVHNGFVEQALLVAGNRLLRILQPENIFLGNARVLFRLFAEILQQADAPLDELQNQGILHIPRELKLRHGQQAPGISRMS